MGSEEFEVISRYEMPIVGSVEIIHASTKDSAGAHGRYFGRVSQIGHVARYSETEHEARTKTSEEIAVFLLKQRKELSDKVHEIDKLIPTTSLGIITSGDWLKKYKKE